VLLLVFLLPSPLILVAVGFSAPVLFPPLFFSPPSVLYPPYIYSGQIQGKLTPDGLARAFRGIPYADPPTGDYRWAAPRSINPWNSILNAEQDGAGCIQKCHLPPIACPPVQSEDCLFLNVFTPRLDTIAQPLPVMAFLPGGAFLNGYGGGPLYDGRYIANTTNTILVVIQYRLGLMGFGANEALSGNFGFFDQQMALHWIQDNIAAFGGDPKRVTLFGQSAGAMSTALHLTADSSRGLFHQAILESEPFALPMRSPTQMHSVFGAFAKNVGCAPDDLTCLRDVTSDNVRTGQFKTFHDIILDIKRPLEAFVPFTPLIGGNSVFQKQPMQALLDGNFTAMPLMITNTREEGNLFVHAAFGKPMSKLEYDVVITALYSLKHALSVGLRYPAGHTTDARPTASRLATDSIFLCPNRNVTRALANGANKNEPVYYGLFDHALKYPKEVWGNQTYCYNVSCHGEELPFVFHSISATPPGQFEMTPGELTLSAQMVLSWTNFAHTGNPNHMSDLSRAASRAAHVNVPTLNWPEYATSSSKSLNFSVPSNDETFFDDDVCNWWDANVGYVWP
jgi:carboxylesterase type B